MIRPGEAPIKEEFWVPKTQDEDQSNPHDNKKRKRGQNKNRKRPFTIDPSNMMCQFVIRGEKCNYMDKCRKNHDKNVFLEKKGEDLGSTCVLFQQFGQCSYGIACRYSKAHLDEHLDNVLDLDKYEKMKIFEVQKTLLKTIQTKLRSRKVQFTRTYEFLDEQKIDYSNEFKQKNQNNQIKKCKSDKNQKTENGQKTGGHNISSEVAANGITRSETCENNVKEEYYCLKSRTKKTVDFRGKLFLSPLTTVGNLPFRRICKEYGADITCGEMAMCDDLLQAGQSEWALLKRHHTEDIFGVQICGSNVIKTTKTCELINSECDVDFIDLNVGCPIDLVFNRGGGSALMDRPRKLATILEGMVKVTDVPITIKMRIGTTDSKLTALNLCESLKQTGVSLITVHGRTRQQRYTKLADWDYITQCRDAASPVPLCGNGDILSFEDYNQHEGSTDGVMIGRGALIKPWLFKEIKEQQHWDISSSERMGILEKYSKYGLEHWGTDSVGIEKTRYFMLEWLSFLHRYIPVGVLEVLPQKINQRPSCTYHGRDTTETLMCSSNALDWVKLTELFLGGVPDGFHFVPKHAANSYS